MWSYLSHVVTLVTCGHTFHMWSALSHLVTIFTCVKNFKIVQKKSALIDLTAVPKVKIQKSELLAHTPPQVSKRDSPLVACSYLPGNFCEGSALFMSLYCLRGPSDLVV